VFDTSTLDPAWVPDAEAEVFMGHNASARGANSVEQPFKGLEWADQPSPDDPFRSYCVPRACQVSTRTFATS